MARKKITPAPQTDVVPQAGSVQQTAADIPVQDLKDRFQARSIPLETDFWNLIDVADCGRKAAGLSPDVDTPATDTGLMLDSTTGQLKVKPETDKGISVSDSGVSVVANNAKGVIVDGSGVGVNHDATLCVVNSTQLSVTQNYVTKSGDSSITEGNLSFASDGRGISFFGGSRIVNQNGGNMLWYKGGNNAPPQICDNNGNNPSNIATESYVSNITSRNYVNVDFIGAPNNTRTIILSGSNDSMSCKIHVHAGTSQHFILTFLGSNLVGADISGSINISNVVWNEGLSPIQKIAYGSDGIHSILINFVIDPSLRTSISINYIPEDFYNCFFAGNLTHPVTWREIRPDHSQEVMF